VLYVIALLCCVIIVLLLRISRAVKKTPYLQASYNTNTETVAYSCCNCRYWQPSDLLPHYAKESGECLRSPETWLLQHVLTRLDELSNRETLEAGYFFKNFTCGMYEPSTKPR